MTDPVEFSEIVRNYAIVFGGVAGLLIAFWRGLAANRQAKASLDQAAIARRGHVTELFNNAVGQLSDERLEIRLGAIYTLKQVSMDYPAFAGPVFQIFSAYVRERSRIIENDEPSADIRSIMELVREALTERQDER